MGFSELRRNRKRQRNHRGDGLCPLPRSTRRGGLRNPVRSTLKHHFTIEFSSSATSNFADYPRPDILSPAFVRWITHADGALSAIQKDGSSLSLMKQRQTANLRVPENS